VVRWMAGRDRKGACFSHWEKLSAELTDEGIGAM
jgi:hypothetical protein